MPLSLLSVLTQKLLGTLKLSPNVFEGHLAGIVGEITDKTGKKEVQAKYDEGLAWFKTQVSGVDEETLLAIYNRTWTELTGKEKPGYHKDHAGGI
jgi:hypothetical protein